MDIENLSREQLLDLIKNKNVEGEQKTCKFVSRNSNKKCTDMANTPWGYCNKHKKTMQSKKEEMNWRAEKDENIEQDQPEIKQIDKTIDHDNPLDSEGAKLYEDINSGVRSPSTDTMFFSTGGGYASNTDLTKLNPKNNSSSNEEPETSSKKPKNKKVKKHKTLKIGRNRFGRFEEPKSHLLFDPETHTVYGVQDQTGKVLKLTPKHYEYCRRKGWKYYEEEEESSESDSESESSGDESTESDSDELESEIESEDEDDYY